MTAVGWDNEDYPDEACTGPCRCTTPPTQKHRKPSLLTRIRGALRLGGRNNTQETDRG